VERRESDCTPPIVCIRGPSGSGKTALCQRLIGALGRDGERVGYVKRTHHPLDLPHKASSRIWTSGAAAMVLRSTDRIQVTLPDGESTVEELVALLPADITLVLLETHEPEPYPSILSTLLAPAGGEDVIGRWALEDIDHDARAVLAALKSRLEDWTGTRRTSL
jgi:molybdopterin-guanine dinucleotide biosynthesis protein MobB